ncbi:hypothetical protein BDV95DRAFT_39791 [Massariosphaeria phaeospora]|uniref:Uncharacterized protein n=1 Tax=Massariosphaeria phaeospora TaxID=100035 RepID=A0A7C8IEY9_9PLEO|nr:hypothetical protein BDV95DRAFT_39791 [Massariosphaeria phaeospora]
MYITSPFLLFNVTLSFTMHQATDNVSQAKLEDFHNQSSAHEDATFRVIPESLITRDQLAQCASNFSAHYGVWGPQAGIEYRHQVSVPTLVLSL